MTTWIIIDKESASKEDICDYGEFDACYADRNMIAMNDFFCSIKSGNEAVLEIENRLNEWTQLSHQDHESTKMHYTFLAATPIKTCQLYEFV